MCRRCIEGLVIPCAMQREVLLRRHGTAIKIRLYSSCGPGSAPCCLAAPLVRDDTLPMLFWHGLII
ncbi:hypothetical protein GCM10007874_51250 [Labrys miyagiensis]|uniref:Uncharacterized protein n=1 Tax=Labrys miyagiensis TaxID=346912 RepID=A0ABQ6CP40_9HYPH|nr:hypothetical protein GCM10007874_51250 [Labrys miyagiensis]